MIRIKILLFGQFSNERAQIARLFGRAELLDYDAPLSHFVTSRFKSLAADADFAIEGGEPKYKPYISTVKKAGCKLALWGCETDWVKRCHATLPMFDLIFARDKEAFAALREAGYSEVVLPKAEPITEPDPVIEPLDDESDQLTRSLRQPSPDDWNGDTPPEPEFEPAPVFEQIPEPEPELESKQEPEPITEPLSEPMIEAPVEPVFELKAEPTAIDESGYKSYTLQQLNPDIRSSGTLAPMAYGVVNRNENIRAASAAGGVFTLLCEEIFGRGGVVFGARYNDNFETVHAMAERMPECIPMRGVKYAYGNTEGIYEQVISCLRRERPVLFTGTSCQIAELYKKLGGDHKLLITADMICGGAADPAVFAAYLKYAEEKNRAPVTAVDLSGKPRGWGRAAARIGSENGTYEVPVNRDPFMRAYRAGLCLRPECHNCPHHGERRASDLTLGSFHAGRKHIPELFDDKGASLVLAHTQKGRDMMDSLVQRAIVCEVPPDTLPEYNASLVTPPTQHKNRDKFYADLPKMRFDKAVSRSIGPAIWGILTEKRNIIPIWIKNRVNQ